VSPRINAIRYCGTQGLLHSACHGLVTVSGWPKWWKVWFEEDRGHTLGWAEALTAIYHAVKATGSHYDTRLTIQSYRRRELMSNVYWLHYLRFLDTQRGDALPLVTSCGVLLLQPLSMSLTFRSVDVTSFAWNALLAEDLWKLYLSALRLRHDIRAIMVGCDRSAATDCHTLIPTEPRKAIDFICHRRFYRSTPFHCRVHSLTAIRFGKFRHFSNGRLCAYQVRYHISPRQMAVRVIARTYS
jgi:hypothetical protein